MNGLSFTVSHILSSSPVKWRSEAEFTVFEERGSGANQFPLSWLKHDLMNETLCSIYIRNLKKRDSETGVKE